MTLGAGSVVFDSESEVDGNFNSAGSSAGVLSETAAIAGSFWTTGETCGIEDGEPEVLSSDPVVLAATDASTGFETGGKPILSTDILALEPGWALTITGLGICGALVGSVFAVTAAAMIAGGSLSNKVPDTRAAFASKRTGAGGGLTFPN